MLARLLIVPFGNVWRLKQKCYSETNHWLRKLYLALYELYQYENNSSLAWNSYFEGEPCFPHGIKSIFVSGGAKFGKNCVIFQQVTVGSSTLPDSQNSGAPTIGNNVFIGAGAKVIGGIRIGDNVRIGANTIVYKDVPPNSVVLSGKQQTLTRDHTLDNRFYSFHGKWVYYDDGNWISVSDEKILKKLRSM